MPGGTATSIVTRITAGRSGTTGPGIRCSPRRTAPVGELARKAAAMAAPRAVVSTESTAAATGNWNKTASGGSSAKDASVVVAADSGDEPPSRQSGRSATVQWLIRSVTALVLIAVAGPALAQQPTQAQANAIRQACRADYQTHCANVPTGGSAALSCLQQNASSLSPGCQTALGAVSHGGAAAEGAPSPPPTARTPGAASAPRMSPRQEVALMRRACGPDYRAFCRGVQPGGGRALACLQDHADSLSHQCRSALMAARQSR